jgi:hypothetical protein
MQIRIRDLFNSGFGIRDGETGSEALIDMYALRVDRPDPPYIFRILTRMNLVWVSDVLFTDVVLYTVPIIAERIEPHG